MNILRVMILYLQKFISSIKIAFYDTELLVLRTAQNIIFKVKNLNQEYKIKRASWMHKQRDRLTYWKKYADPELYNKCMQMGLNKRAGRYICLEVNFYYRIPKTLSVRKTKKIYTDLNNKGINLSDIVNTQMQEAINDYENIIRKRE